MKEVYKKSLDLHAKHHGKIELKSKVPLNDKKDLSLAYTPGVAQVSSEIGKNKKLTKKYTLKNNTVAVVSDGSAILGLGNLGPEAAIPVMEGKAVLFKQFAGVDAFPICLDTQDTEEIIRAVKLIAPVFGGINLEDISAPRCFEIERRLIEELDIPVMHDDQKGTATVVLAALINSLKVKKLDKSKAKVVINGAGAAGIAVANLMIEYGVKNIVICDSQGIISRKKKDLNGEKKRLAKLTNSRGLEGELADAMRGADVFVGVSKANTVTHDMVKSMADKPVILAMANPIPEIMPDEALKAGAFIVGTGRSDFPNQVNNVLVFPGVFRGALDNGVKKITSKMLVKAAQNLAGCVAKPTPNQILPSIFDRSVLPAIVKAIR
jgi:malate dehydrogenase (oxaloacetate-decarboxylating)